MASRTCPNVNFGAYMSDALTVQKILPPVYSGCLSSEYELHEEIGRGRFGVVRKCTERRSGKELVCKSVGKTLLQV